MSASRFSPGLVPSVALVVAVAILGSLGTWQMRRHAWRQEWLAERSARIDLPPVPWQEVAAAPERHAGRRTVVRGRYLYGEQILVERIRRELEEGARVLTPLVLEGSEPRQALIVDRGWIPYRRQAEFLAQTGLGDPVELRGLVFSMPLPPANSEPVTRRRTWIRFDPGEPRYVAALAAQLGVPLAPALVQREAIPGESAPLGGISRPESPVDHLAYAATWYGMAFAAFAVWIGLGVKNARDRAGGDRRPMPPAPPRGPR